MPEAPVPSEDDGHSGTIADDAFLLENFLPYRLVVLTTRISRELARLYQDRFGLSIAEWRVMANLARFAPLSAQEVAERGSMDKAKASRAISKMLARGLITRDRDPSDNRATILNLSPKGREIYDEIAPLAANWERRLLQALPPGGEVALHETIDRLHRGLDTAGD